MAKKINLEELQQTIAANIQSAKPVEKPQEQELPQPVQIETPDIGQPEKPVTDPTQVSEDFKPGGTVGMSGEPLPSIKLLDGSQWMASMFDQYGKPYWGDIDPDPNFWSEVENAMKNWWGNVVFDFQNKDTTPIDIIVEENWDTVPDSFKQAGVAISDKTGTFGEDATKAFSPIAQTVGEGLATAGRAWTNGEKVTLPYGIGYVLKAVKHIIGGAFEVLGNVGYGAERLIGTVGNKIQMGENISWYESWAASRIAYSSVAKEGLTAEYLRRYRAGENPILLMQELQNPLAEAFGQSILDPTNLLSGGMLGGAKAASKGVTIAEDGADLLKAVNAVEDVAKAENAVSAADKLVDATRTINQMEDVSRGVNAVEDVANVVDDVTGMANMISSVDEVVDSAKVIKKAETPLQKLSNWVGERVR